MPLRARLRFGDARHSSIVEGRSMGMTEENPPSPPAPAATPRSKLTTTIGLSLFVAVLLYVIGASLGKSYGPALFCIPFFMGVVAGALAPRRPYLTTLGTLVVAL